MSDARTYGIDPRRGMRWVAAVAVASFVGAAVAASPLIAQDKKAPAAKEPAAKEAAPAAAPAPKAGAAPAAKDAAAAPAGKDGAPKGKQSAWVKLCEKAPFTSKDKDGKDAKEEKEICLTHHERLEGTTGMVLVSAAIRQLEGSDKQSIMIMLPLGMAIPPGVRAAVYTKEQWAQAAKNEKIDEKALKPVELKYSLCHNAGCTAEAEATPELIEQMKTGGGMMVLAINPAAKPIGFPVPLEGFGDAYAGKPIDNKQYAEARSQLMKQIRQRQIELAEKHKAEQEELKKDKTDLLKTDPNPKADPKKAEGPKADAKTAAPAEKKK